MKYTDFNEYLAAQPDAIAATLDLNKRGVPVSYFTLKRWRDGDFKPSPIYRRLLTPLGFTFEGSKPGRKVARHG